MRELRAVCWYLARALEQCAGLGLLLIASDQRGGRIQPAGVIQLVKEAAVNHLFLPGNRHCPCAELLEELLVAAVKLHGTPDFGEVVYVTCVLSVDHVGLGRPGGLNESSLQTSKIDGLKPFMFPGVVATGGKHKCKQTQTHTTKFRQSIE